VTLDKEALYYLIRYYTREAGVRNLERSIGSVVRKIAVKVAGGEPGPFTVTPDEITEIPWPGQVPLRRGRREG
jgi:ATP-dependent Lon protease